MCVVFDRRLKWNRFIRRDERVLKETENKEWKDKRVCVAKNAFCEKITKQYHKLERENKWDKAMERKEM